jgi:hypothetical protein
MKKHTCNLFGFGMVMGWVMGLATSTRKGKEFREDLWKGYRDGGILGKWKVLQKELAGAGGEFITMIDEVLHSPEFEEMVDKGKVHLDKLQEETRKATERTRKTIAEKAKHMVEKKPVAKSVATNTSTSKTATKKTTTQRKPKTSSSSTMKKTVRKVS